MYFNNNVETNIDKNFTKKSKININPKMILFITMLLINLIYLLFIELFVKKMVDLLLKG